MYIKITFYFIQCLDDTDNVALDLQGDADEGASSERGLGVNASVETWVLIDVRHQLRGLVLHHPAGDACTRLQAQVYGLGGGDT